MPMVLEFVGENFWRGLIYGGRGIQGAANLAKEESSIFEYDSDRSAYEYTKLVVGKARDAASVLLVVAGLVVIVTIAAA